MENYEQKYKDLIAEIKERKNLISAEKDKANSMNEKLSLGGRVAILQELLAFANDTESEDEKIRKEILKYLEERKILELEVEPYHINEWIAWLEKQCEKMSDQRHGILDKLIEADDIYQMSVNDAMVEEAKNKAIEALSKLEISKLLGLEKQGERKKNVTDIISDLKNYFATTTKEQQEKDWDEIKKWEEKHFNHDKHVEQKPTCWSEEDENMLTRCIGILGKCYMKELPNKVEEELIWLKSIKNKIQPKKELSEEDRERLLRIHQFIWANRKGDTDEIYQQEQDADWLMTLKPNNWKPSEQNIKDLEWCADLVKDKMGVGFHRLQVFIDELKSL